MKSWFLKHWPKMFFVFFAVLMVWSSVADTLNRGDRLSNPALFDEDRAYDLIERYSLEPRPRGSTYHEEVRQGLISDIADAGFTAIEMDYRLTRDDTLEWGGYYGQSLIADSLVRNLLVHIPGTGTSGDAILFMGHYDSVPMGPGANDNMIAVATMMEMLYAIDENDLTFENDLIFFFPDGEEEGLLGARFFANQRTPHNVVDSSYVELANHVKFMINHDSRGTGGTAIMFETTAPNAQSIRYFAEMNRDIYTNSIANLVYSMMPNGTDYSAFSILGVQGINVANVGEGYNYHTQYDRLEEFDSSLLEQHIQLDHNVLRVLGDEDLDQLYASDENAVFFSYLNLGIIYYSQLIAWIALVLMLGGIGLLVFQSRSSWKKLLLGLATLVILMVVTVVTLMVIRPILEMIPVFGPRVAASSYASMNLMVTLYAIATAVLVATYRLLKKWFPISAVHVAQASLILFTILGTVLTLVLYEISFLFVVPALLGVFVWDVAHNHFKGLHDAWLYPLITFLYFPLAYPMIALASDALGASMYDLISIVYVLLVSFALPFASDALEHTSRQAIRWSVASGSLILALIFGSMEIIAPQGHSLSTNLSGKASGRSVLFTDDALIWDMVEGSTTSQLIVVDYDAARYIEPALKSAGFELDTSEAWNTSTAYQLAISTTFTKDFYDVTEVGDTLTFTVSLIEDVEYAHFALDRELIEEVTIVEDGLSTTFLSTDIQGMQGITVFHDAIITIRVIDPNNTLDLMIRHYSLATSALESLAAVTSELTEAHDDLGLHFRQSWTTYESFFVTP